MRKSFTKRGVKKYPDRANALRPRVGEIKEGQAWAEVMMQNVTKTKEKSDMKFALQMANSYPNDGANVLDLRQHPQKRIRW